MGKNKKSMKIVLIGFMGAGKTTVGKEIAKKIHLPFVEMDELVLKKSGRKTINDIFQNKGEPYFRELEIAVAKKLKDKNNMVVSTGGGVVMNKIIIDYLKTGGVVFYLNSSFQTAVKRLINFTDRPLFKNKKKAKKLYDFRQPLYKQYADYIINTNNKSVDEVVISLMKYLNENFRKN